MNSHRSNDGRKSTLQQRFLALEVIGVPMFINFGNGLTEDELQEILTSWSHCRLKSPTAPSSPPQLDGFQAQFTIGQHAADARNEPSAGLGAVRGVRSNNAEQLSDRLTSALTVAAIENRSGDLMMFHAAGLANPQGQVMALVAASGTGKSTAAVALGHHLSYVTDETVAVDLSGVVVRYPKPVSLLGRTDNARKKQLGPSELGLKVATATLRLRRIVLLSRRDDDDGAPPTIAAVPLFEALVALIPQTSSLSRLPDPLGNLMSVIQDCGGVWRATYSEAESLIPLLSELLKSEARISYEWTYSPYKAAVPRGDELVQARNFGTIWSDGEAIVLLENEFLHVRGIGVPIWRAAHDGVGLREVHERVAQEYGRPEGYRSMVNEAISTMMGSKLLEKT